MPKVLFNSFIFLLPLLLIPVAQSVEKTEINEQIVLMDQPESSSVNTDGKLAAEEATENNNIQEEMAAVGGNISAVFIVWAFHERAETLQRLTEEAMEMVATQANSKDHPHWVKMLDDSKLTDKQMVMLRDDLVNALNNLEEANGQKYLNNLAQFLEAFGAKKGLKKKGKGQKQGIKGSASASAAETAAAAQESLSLTQLLAEKCHQLHLAHTDFLAQIQLEILLHSEFMSKDLDAFQENAQQLEQLKNSNKLKYDKKLEKAKNLWNTVRKNDLERKQDENNARTNYENSANAIRQQNSANKAGDDMYYEIKDVLDLFKGEQPYVTSILELAGNAIEKKGHWEHTFKKLLNFWVNFEKKRQLLWYKQMVTDEIKLEMPREWYSNIQAEAFPPPHDKKKLTVTVEMVQKRIQMLMAKTQLVYNRLNAYYKIDDYHKIWLNGQRPQEIRHLLLNSYFAELELVKRGFVEATISPANDHVPTIERNDVTDDQIHAVGDNISAVYIVRAIHKRAVELKALQKRAIVTVNSKYAPELSNDDIMLASEAERLQILWHYGEAYELWKDLLKESIMTDEEIAQIEWLNAELASALKDEARRQIYVAKLDALLQLFSPKLRQLEINSKLEAQLAEQSAAHSAAQSAALAAQSAAELCHQLRQSVVDFLEQARLEVQLHYAFATFNDDQRAFLENAHRLEELKTSLDKQYNTNLRDTQTGFHDSTKWDSETELGKHNHKKRVYYNQLENANQAGNDLYIEIKMLLDPLRDGSTYVRSILEVVLKAREKGQNENWKNKLNKLAHVWRIAQQSSLFPLLDLGTQIEEIEANSKLAWGTQIKEIQAKIREKLEMPKEWFFGCKQQQAASFSKKVKGRYDAVTDEEKMVVCGITLFLAKILLVYERLNAYYMIDHHYKLWKDGQRPMEIPYIFLNSHFAEVELENHRKVIGSPSDGNRH